MRTSSSRARIMMLLETDFPNNHSNANNPTRRRLQGMLKRGYRYNVERLPYAKIIQGPNSTSYEVSAQYLEAMNQIMFLLQENFNMTPGGKCITPTNPVFTDITCHMNGLPGAESRAQIAIGGCDNTTSLPDEINDALTDFCAAPPTSERDIYIVGGVTGGLIVLLIAFIVCAMYHNRHFYRAEWHDRFSEERRRLGLPATHHQREDESEEELKEDADFADHEHPNHQHEEEKTYDERGDGHPYSLVPTEEKPPVSAASTTIGIRRP